MDLSDQIKWAQRQSSHSSQAKNKRRPSLFPLRNSAKRKNSSSQLANISQNTPSSHPDDKKPLQSICQDIYQQKEIKNENNELQLKSLNSSNFYSSPKTPKSVSKQFNFDTPFIPFVHQSLTRTLWQSDDVIPEERDDLDRKQSQTQFHYHHDQFNQENSPLYPISTIEAAEKNTHLQQGQPQNGFLTPQIQTVNPQQNPNKNLQTCKFATISVPPTQPFPNTEKLNEVSSIKDILQMPYKIDHETFISKAQLYFRQEKQNIQKNGQTTIYNQNLMLPTVMDTKLKYSYLQCISVRQKQKSYTNQNKDNLYKNASLQTQNYQRMNTDQKQCKYCQTQLIKLHICNNTHTQIISMKKRNTQQQSSFSTKLMIVSNNYAEKIGIPKQHNIPNHGTHIEKTDSSQQTVTTTTDKTNQLNIHKQVNISISQNYLQQCGEHQRQQNDFKNINDTTELPSFGIKNQQLIWSINMINIGCQYNIKDFGGRSALKRVSISQRNVIFDLPLQESITETKQIAVNKKRESKSKKQKKNKQSQPKIKQHKPASKPSQIHVNAEPARKSKRKSSKTVQNSQKN